MKLFFLFLLSFFSLVFFFLALPRPTAFLSPPPPPSPSPTPTPLPKIFIGLVGDLGLGRTITSYARSQNNFSYSFSAVSSWLAQNSFTLANLESPIIKNCPSLPPATMIFCADTRFLPSLSENKFIFNLANNHILNFGPDGLKQTQNLLTQYSLPFVYSHQQKPQFITQTINGISFGFLGFDLTGAHQYSNQEILRLTAAYDSQVDWLILSLHWGQEYKPVPQSWQVDLAHQLVSSGADIIHGHHPHVWQEPETYQGKLIFYSLGNFIFDQNWSHATSHSYIVRLTLTRHQLLDYQIFPVQIQNNIRPVILSP